MVKIDTGLLFAEILIVDSGSTFTQAVRPALQAAGYIVRRVAAGEEALSAIRSQPPDLILLAASLPDVDGYEVTRQIKADEGLPFLPVILMAEGEEGEGAAALDAGADEVIVRPVDNGPLLTRVRAMLRLKEITDQLAELTETLEQRVEERTQDLLEAQERLRHAEKLTALGRMSASIAHEINNPLTAILGHLYLAKRGLAEGSPVREDLAIVEREVNTISKLVQQLRDFSKPPVQDREVISLNDVVEEVLALVGKELRRHQIDVETELDPALPPVTASPGQMREVLLNLVLNAQDAMDGGGALAIRTAVDREWVTVEVADTGSGIPDDIIDYIFEPFFTTKGENGTGLGLAICHSIAHDHDGEITVETEVGQGSAFTLQLPEAGTGEI